MQLHALACSATLLTLSVPPQQGTAAPPLRWKTLVLDTAFRSEGVAVADVDRDGQLDVLAGEFWYRAPNWTRSELAPPGAYDPATGYSDCFIAAASDVDRDGWTDFLSVGFPGGEARWFRNPAGAPGHWRRHPIARAVSNESPAFVDIDGDGRVELIMGLESARRVVWLEAGIDPTAAWSVHPIGAPGQPGFLRFDHGLGYADVDGDGRADVLTPDGWYAGPPDPHSSPWPFHGASWLGSSPYGPQRAAQMYTQDIDGDGDLDVLTSSPHAYGVWWWECTGSTSWVEHLVADSFSQSHALVSADIDGDGVRDLVTGKRWYAHGPGGDPGAQEPALLVWFRVTGNPAGPLSGPQTIHGDSGIGTQFVCADVDGDGRLDVVTSSKKGVFVHLQR